MQSANVSSRRGESHSAAPATLRQITVAKLDRLCEGLGCHHLLDRAVGVLDVMCHGWKDLPALAEPYWPSDITDDGSPVEFSVAFSEGRTELRVLAEAQRLPATLANSWRTGLELNHRLARDHGANFERFDRVRDIFAPIALESPRFALWHSAAIDSSGSTIWKAYLNPAIQGESQAPSVVRAALGALEMSAAWRFLSTEVSEGGRFVYFALDLTHSEAARVKVYVAYRAADVERVDAMLSRAKLSMPGQITDWVEALTGGRTPLDQRGLQVCYSFRADNSQPDMTLYVPVRSFCEHDAEALTRGCRFLAPTDAANLTRAVRHMAGRPLETGRGLITYFALSLRSTKPRLTVYISPEIYAVALARPLDVRPSGPPIHSMIRDLRPSSATRTRRVSFAPTMSMIEDRRRMLASHPFITTLNSEEGSLEDVQCISARVAFFVMCFQDVLRLVHKHTTDPVLKEIARNQELEDKGHDRWYLQDLERMGVSIGLRELFSVETEAVRDIAYTQVSDVLRASSDCSRLGVVLALEAAGAEFFESMIGFVERQNRSRGLQYFGRRHQRVEQSHEILAESAQSQLASMEVEATVLVEVMDVVERTFETMTRLADHLLLELKGRSHAQVSLLDAQGGA